jgi:hypothetical protein
MHPFTNEAGQTIKKTLMWIMGQGLEEQHVDGMSASSSSMAAVGSSAASTNVQ